MNKKKSKELVRLHILLIVYSLSGLLSKKASEYSFLSFTFLIYYCGVILILGIYAIGWQQIIKNMSLSSAFSNKAVTVIWGLVWGLLFYNEQITIGKVIGALLVISGIVIYSIFDSKDS